MLFENVKRESEKILAKAKGSHDWEHTERVLLLASLIAAKEKADVKTVRLAAVLHDIARPEEDRSKGRVDHAKLGAKKAALILKKYKAPAGLIKAVSHCIESHRYRGIIKPRTPEAKALFDADKLDSIGAVGVGRAFLFAGEVGARLHNGGKKVASMKAYSRDDTAYREYMVKLRHVKKRMLTKTGRKMAVKRHFFMEKFFRRLGAEIKGRS